VKKKEPKSKKMGKKKMSKGAMPMGFGASMPMKKGQSIASAPKVGKGKKKKK
jgi:hypothetical protein